MRKRNIHIVIATTLFAIMLWFSVSMSEHYQIHVTAPLIIESLPPGKSISSKLPRVVKLTFNDFGWRLAKVAWGSNVRWVIDLNAMPANATALTIRDFEEQLGSRLGVQPISMTPESLYITLDDFTTKRIIVEPRYTVTFRDGYGQIGKILVLPESVTVSGARNIVDHIETWPTTRKLFNGLRQTVDVVVPLVDSVSSLAFSPDQVTLRLNIQQFAEKVFSGIPIEFISVPQDRDVILSTSKIEVVVRGGIDILARVSQNDFRAFVDYRVILEDLSGNIQPEIIAPAGIQVVKRTPERLQYVIRKKI